jgi:hypothetical protein
VVRDVELAHGDEYALKRVYMPEYVVSVRLVCIAIPGNEGESANLTEHRCEYLSLVNQYESKSKAFLRWSWWYAHKVLMTT